MRKNRKYFNVNGDCKPGMHYMVDLTGRLGLIKAMVDAGEYFTINRARQFGKTTTLKALERYLGQKSYLRRHLPEKSWMHCKRRQRFRQMSGRS